MFKWLKQHNVFIWALSLMISLMLWAYVAVVQDPEISMTISGIPTVFKDEEKVLAPRDLMILSGKDTTLEIRFTGRRSDLAKIRRENVILNVDLSAIGGAGTASCAYTVTLPAGLGTVVTEKRSDYVIVTVDRIRDKPVYVVLEADVTPAEQYLLETEVLDPDTILLRGPSSLLDTVSYAKVRVSKENATKKIEQLVDYTLHTDTGELVSSEYITGSVPDVRVTIPVVMTKKVPFRIPFIDGGGLSAEKNIVCTFDPPYILLSGDPTILEGINNITLKTIDLAELVDSTTIDYDQFQIPLPNDVKNVGNLTSVQAEIEIVGVETRVIGATDISVTGMHPPDGYMVVIETRTVSVTLRGAKETLELISPHSVRIVADITNMAQTPGSHTVTGRAYLDGFSSVGIVGGSYDIVISIEPVSASP